VGVLLLTGRLVLAGVLLVAAVAKLADRAGARRSLEAFGVPAALAPAAAVALPVAELLVGAALVPVATAWVAALAATALLVSFSVAIAVAIRRGVQADCHCFGRLSSEHVGRGTLARNLALLVPAVFVAVAGAGDAGTSATAWLGDLSAAAALGLAGGVLVSAALAVNFAFLFQLLKQNGRLWAEIEKLRGGARAPDGAAPRLALPDLSGRLVELDDLLDGDRGLLLVFSDPHCAACDPLLPEIGRRQGDRDADPTPVLVSLGTAEDIRAKVSDHGIELVLLAGNDFEIARSFGVRGLPGAVAVDADGRVSGDPAIGTDPVLELLTATSGRPRLVEVNGHANG
jgi:uncharacterized membrane protein YphA (DoxX/SURF4 family)/peroxiredoxin